MFSWTARAETARPRADMSWMEMLTGVASRTRRSALDLRLRKLVSSISRTTVTVSVIISPAGSVPYASQ